MSKNSSSALLASAFDILVKFKQATVVENTTDTRYKLDQAGDLIGVIDEIKRIKTGANTM